MVRVDNVRRQNKYVHSEDTSHVADETGRRPHLSAQIKFTEVSGSIANAFCVRYASAAGSDVEVLAFRS